MPHKPLQAPKNKAQIAAQLYWLSDHMLDIATSMDHYCEEMHWHDRSGELIGAAGMAREWADRIGDEYLSEVKK